MPELLFSYTTRVSYSCVLFGKNQFINMHRWTAILRDECSLLTAKLYLLDLADISTPAYNILDILNKVRSVFKITGNIFYLFSENCIYIYIQKLAVASRHVFYSTSQTVFLFQFFIRSFIKRSMWYFYADRVSI